MVKQIEKRGFKSFAGMMLTGAFIGFLLAVPGILVGARVLYPVMMSAVLKN